MTNKKKEEFSEDIHELLIKEFWIYSHHQERFERYGYKLAARWARNSLRRIRDLSYARYLEIQKKNKTIQAQKKERKASKKDI